LVPTFRTGQPELPQASEDAQLLHAKWTRQQSVTRIAHLQGSAGWTLRLAALESPIAADVTVDRDSLSIK
jgi:hypothetical protein